jgi:uncharacterized protein with LGFP repeats
MSPKNSVDTIYRTPQVYVCLYLLGSTACYEKFMLASANRERLGTWWSGKKLRPG